MTFRRWISCASLGAALVLAAPLPAQAAPQSVDAALRSAASNAPAELRGFYRARGNRPLWIGEDGLREEADLVLRLIETANADGLDPQAYRPRELRRAIEEAREGSPRDLARAEMLLSRRFAAYVRDVRQPRDVGMVYADAVLRPTVPTAAAVLTAAAGAPSLRQYLSSIGWMNPIYAQLRNALASGDEDMSVGTVVIPAGATLRLGSDEPRVAMLRQRLGMDGYGPFDADLADAVTEFQRMRGLPADGVAGARTIEALNRSAGAAQAPDHLLRLNLDRARALPAELGRRYVLVNAAAARLWLYEDGRVVDTMRVVVGKPSQQTPMMAGLIRYTTLNPYWNVPPDLVRERIAPRVLSEGQAYLRERRYEILSDWSEAARPLAPAAVDWGAVASGRRELRVRQLPGPDNAMGRMKFMFPNDLGVYLHDTPDRSLLREEARMFSAGCVRLEDAPRLARWLFGRTVRPRTGAPEQRVNLDEPVPVYITYLTAAPEAGRVTVQADVYNRDARQLAEASGPRRGRRR